MFVSASKIKEMMMETLDSDMKVAVIASFDEIVNINKLNRNNFTLHVCKEDISMAQVVMFLRKNSFLKEAFDQKIALLKTNGLINFWISKYMSNRYLVEDPPVNYPEKLTLHQVLSGFELWAACLVLSLLFFTLELIIHKYGKGTRA